MGEEWGCGKGRWWWCKRGNGKEVLSRERVETKGKRKAPL